MTLTADAIIQEVNRSYPPSPAGNIGSCSDLNIAAKINNINQYIIGITPSKQGDNIEHYQFHMQNQLFELNAKVKCLAWRFGRDEEAEMRPVLNGLAIHFMADLAVEKMLKKAYRTKQIGIT